MFIQTGAETVDKSDYVNVQGHLVHAQSTRAMRLQVLRKDAALQKFAKDLAVKKLQCAGVILPVKMTGTAQHTPGLKVFGNCWVQQRVLKAARVVAIGFGRCWPTRVRMRVRACWTCGGRHR